jgi:inner membrane protease subunit 2
MRVARVLAPLLPISLWFSEHVYQVMWVRGPSMMPYLNENYEEMNTASDMVLVNMWPWEKIWPGQTSRRLERGMVVTFRYFPLLVCLGVAPRCCVCAY